MNLRTSYYINEDPKPIGRFESPEAAKKWWQSNRLSPWDDKKLIRVETNLDLVQKTTEDDRS